MTDAESGKLSRLEDQKSITIPYLLPVQYYDGSIKTKEEQFMNYENFDNVPELDKNTTLSGFQNPSFSDMTGQDLMPRIRFTTDKAEADQATRADRSDPFNLPESVFYVEGGEDASKGGEKSSKGRFEGGSFQNDSFGIDTSKFIKDTSGTSGEYVGPSVESLDLKIESDVKHLTFCQEQLAEAIASGTGVMTAMHAVESAEAVLNAHMKLYNEAVKFRPPEPPRKG